MSTQKRTDGTVLINTASVTPPAATTLNGAINNSVTAITVTSGTNVVNGTYITIQAEGANTTETVLVTAGGGTANPTVTRAQLGTAASAHADTATVTLPGHITFTLLTIAEVPNTELFVRKSTTDINYVLLTAGGANVFPNGGTTIILRDSGDNGTAHIKFPAFGNTLILLASGSGSVAGPAGPAGPSATAPGNVTITALSLEQDPVPDGGLQPTFHLSVTPPSPLGTFLGCHLYVEYPDQSGISEYAVGTGVIGTDALQGTWTPFDLGLQPYIAAQQPWRIPLSVDLGNAIRDLAGAGGSGAVARVYAASYSAEVDNLLVRATDSMPTPSSTCIVTLSPTRPKPQSGSNITPLLVTAVTASVLPTVLVGGVLKRPIAIGVDLSGLPSVMPDNWGYELIGWENNDLTTDIVLDSGQYTAAYTTGSPAPAGPDGISVPHTFGPDEPSRSMSITIYAVAGLFRDNPVPGRPRPRGGGPLVWTPNNIVAGHTASVTITIGTTTGVVDPTKFVAANLSPVFGNVASLFDIVPQGIDNTRQGLLSVSSINLAALAVTNPKLALLSVTAAVLDTGSVTTAKLAALAVDAAALASSSVTATKIANAAVGTAAIANAAVGTAAIQNAAITNALIANAAVGTANIQNLAVTNALIANLAVDDAKISNLAVSKLLAGTITVAVSMTAPTIIATGSNAGVTTTVTVSPASFPFQAASSNGNTLTIGNTGLVYTATGLTTVLTPGTVLVSGAAGNSILTASSLVVAGLPSASPGAGTKALWYDPADGNRVKYAP